MSIDAKLLSSALGALRKDLTAPHKARLAFINKSQGLPLDADPQHSYSHRMGSYGDYSYHYKDPLGNYWKYTNAPGDNTHHDPVKGDPMISEDQPMPHTAPEFFTPSGYKRHVGVPTGSTTVQNARYNPDDPANVWFEKFKHPMTGQEHYTYLDKDVKEQPELHVQHNLRLVDAGMLKYRMLANKLYLSGHQRDVCLGVLMFLMDQAFFELDELLSSTVGDLTFVGHTVILNDRKFTCDYKLYYTLTKLVAGRDPSQPLLFQQTAQGLRPLGKYLVNAIFDRLGFRPQFLKYWHATQLFSTIVHRMTETGHGDDDLGEQALKELAAYMHTSRDVSYLVDTKVRTALLQVSAASPMLKSLVPDKYGVPYVRTDLVERTPDEQAFSVWLHAAPMHDAPVEESTSEEPTNNLDVPPVNLDPVSKSATYTTFGIIVANDKSTQLPTSLVDARVLLTTHEDTVAHSFVKSVQASQAYPVVGMFATDLLAVAKSLLADNVPVVIVTSDSQQANQAQQVFLGDMLYKAQVSLNPGHFSSFLFNPKDVRILSLNAKEYSA